MPVLAGKLFHRMWWHRASCPLSKSFLLLAWKFVSVVIRRLIASGPINIPITIPIAFPDGLERWNVYLSNLHGIPARRFQRPQDNTKLLLSLAYPFQHEPKVHENILRQTLLICDCVYDIIIFFISKISIDMLENIYKNGQNNYSL